jgi:plastocyanin/heme-degrading monooxygenase HmoA
VARSNRTQVIMEYVQTVLAQVAATKAADADGLISELESHRPLASSQRGFRGMNISRTANPEGDVLIVIETRWAGNNDMADYSTLKSNAASIIGARQDILVPNSLQVHRMEAVDAPAAAASNRIYDRLALALLIPVGVLAFALLTIYGLSRIYLSLPGNAATPLAAGLAIGILFVSWYFATNPSVPRWQILGVVVVALGTLAIGGTAAAIYDDNNKEYKQVAAPTPATGASPVATTPAGQPVIDMEDNVFKDGAGNSNPTITVTGANTAITIPINNKGAAIHNVHIASTGSFAQPFCKAAGDEPCSKPASVSAGTSASITFTLAAGTYDFRCDFHPDQMKGKIEVK